NGNFRPADQRERWDTAAGVTSCKRTSSVRPGTLSGEPHATVRKECPMLRSCICALLALTLVTGVSPAAGKGKAKAKAFHGTIKKVDAQAGTFTVSVKSKKTQATDMEFKLAGDSNVLIRSGTELTAVAGKEGLKNAAFKEGAAVTVVTNK